MWPNAFTNATRMHSPTRPPEYGVLQRTDHHSTTNEYCNATDSIHLRYLQSTANGYCNATHSIHPRYLQSTVNATAIAYSNATSIHQHDFKLEHPPPY